MRAVQERIPSYSTSIPDRFIWHRPNGRPVEDFQAIACSTEEGITLPGPSREIPASDANWCQDCRIPKAT
jgi:hypothetical protein